MKTYKGRGIVLHTLKYGDSSMVVYLLTGTGGRRSYMVQGVRSRSCIDSAPLRERDWAVRCGRGDSGRNSQLIVPGLGAFFFRSAIITEAPLPADEPCSGSCGSCGRCVRA